MGPVVAGFLCDINSDYFVALCVVGIMFFIGFVFAVSLKHETLI